MYDGIVQLQISSLKMFSLGRENIEISLRGEHAGTMVDSEVSPEPTNMLGRFSVVLLACLPSKDTYQLR